MTENKMVGLIALVAVILVGMIVAGNVKKEKRPPFTDRQEQDSFQADKQLNHQIETQLNLADHIMAQSNHVQYTEGLDETGQRHQHETLVKIAGPGGYVDAIEAAKQQMNSKP